MPGFFTPQTPIGAAVGQDDEVVASPACSAACEERLDVAQAQRPRHFGSMRTTSQSFSSSKSGAA